MRRNHRPYYINIAVLVVAFVLILDFISILSPDRAFSPVENRNLQLRPELTESAWSSGRFADRYESFVSDQFPFRNLWIRVKSSVDLLSGKKESNGVYLGKDGYLIQDFVSPGDEDFEAFSSSLKTFVAENPDLNYYALVAPTAVNLLKDKLPSYAAAVAGDQNVYLDRLSALFDETGIHFVDVREGLISASENNQIYYKTDHHWTTMGAYAAYRVLANDAGLDGLDTKYKRIIVSDSFHGTLSASGGFRMSESDEIYVYLPKTEETEFIVSYEEEQVKTPSFYTTAHLEERDQYALFLDGNHSLVIVNTNNTKNNTLLVFKDSYANCLIPFLVGDYREIVIVDPRYYADDISTLIKIEQVSDVLFLYNANTLAQDTNLTMLLSSVEEEEIPEGEEDNSSGESEE